MQCWHISNQSRQKRAKEMGISSLNIRGIYWAFPPPPPHTPAFEIHFFLGEPRCGGRGEFIKHKGVILRKFNPFLRIFHTYIIFPEHLHF